MTMIQWGFGSTISYHLSKVWKTKFSILWDVIVQVRLQEIFEPDHSREWKGHVQWAYSGANRKFSSADWNIFLVCQLFHWRSASCQCLTVRLFRQGPSTSTDTCTALKRLFLPLSPQKCPNKLLNSITDSVTSCVSTMQHFSCYDSVRNSKKKLCPPSFAAGALIRTHL